MAQEPIRGETFPKMLRLRTRRDFLRVGKRGRRTHTRDFVVLVDRGRPEIQRIGITTSRQVGNSAVRNRIKRLIREYYRRHRMRFSPGTDYVVIVKSPAQIEGLRDVERNFEQFFRKSSERSRPGRPGGSRPPSGV